MDFIRQARFLMIHVFPYSKRAGTPAAAMKGQVPEAVKHERVARLSCEAARIRASLLDEMVGRTVSVLFETYENGVARGHTPHFVEVACPASHPLNAITRRVRITGHTDAFCLGDILD